MARVQVQLAKRDIIPSDVGRIPLAEFAHLHRQRAANEGESINSNLD
jgi:hypothetical protein